MTTKRVLATIDAGGRPVYMFLAHDESSIKLKAADESGQYVILDKQALPALASTLRDLAQKLTE